MKKIVGVLIGFLFLAGCGGEDDFTFEEQLIIDIAKIDEYLASNNLDAEIHERGIRFNVTEEGDGRTPGLGNVAVLIYDFKVLGRDEVVGESVYGDSFTLNEVLMRALFFMLEEMKVGEKRMVYAPSGYCFGRLSNALIPANSSLVFNLELVDVATDDIEQEIVDLAIIDRFLRGNDIQARVHESGIRYTVQAEGMGESPTIDDRVVVVYEGRFLNGNVFDQSEDNTSFDLADLVEAWQIMIPTMKPGGKITIYAPSGLCYGRQGSASIPGNTNLIFDIELISN